MIILNIFYLKFKIKKVKFMNLKFYKELLKKN